MIWNRRAKIVATLGPATYNEAVLERAVLAGLNVARLNFSHGTHSDHANAIQMIRRISAKHKIPVAILQDLQGPKIRVGKFEKGFIELIEGTVVTFTTDPVVGTAELIPSDFAELPMCCKKGTKILLDDGLLELEAVEVSGKTVKAKVIYGGILKDRKGMNLPGEKLPVEPMTEKDFKDLEFGLEQKVDYVALSFVRQGKDIRKLRELIDAKGSAAKIIAKIEMMEALEHLEEIVRLSDAVMVARGDLAVEVGQSRLPGMQKKIISLCNQIGRPVITATQMLDSMVDSPRPTRAEITDVANAILDGSDALMLSAESASGKYPVECIRTMSEIIVEVEQNGEEYYRLSLENEFLSVPASIAASACLSALKLNATAIVCLTTTGKTSQIISGFRPKAQIISITHQMDTLNRLALVWGIQTLKIEPYKAIRDVLIQVDELLTKLSFAKTGDRVIITLGQPIAAGSKTNSMFVHTIS